MVGCYATTVPFLEDIAASEVSKILGTEVEERPEEVRGRIAFEAEPEEIVKLNYLSRSLHRIMILLDSFEIEDLDSIYDGMKGLDYHRWLKSDQTFAVRPERIGEHDFDSPDIGDPAGQAVIDTIKNERGRRQEVDLDYPDVIFRIEVIGERCFVALDTTGEDSLHKRGYKVFQHRAALNPTIAYGMLKIIDWKPKEILLDPMTGSGTIPIEATMLAKNVPPAINRKENFAFLKLREFDSMDKDELFSKEDEKIREIDLGVHGYDKDMRNISGARKNSKLARVKEEVHFGRFDLSWLDTKFKQGEVDKVVVNPPYGVRTNPSDISKIYRDLFWQTEYILDMGGRICLITTRDDLVRRYKKRYKFEMTQKRKAVHGGLTPEIFVLRLLRKEEIPEEERIGNED